jgi:hypothetical protein
VRNFPNTPKKGDRLLRSSADFEHKRVTILNPALVSRPRFMPLEAPPSGPLELDADGDELPELDLIQIDPIAEGSDTEEEASRPSTHAQPKPSSPQVKATLRLGKAKLGKKSPTLKGPSTLKGGVS